MAISIHTNLMAGNAARTLGSHYNRLSKSVQRLSSGLRINSAADDAAGLAIRELMRADVSTLNQGIRNANDAISMIQTADGALAVIDEKLIRMKELAEQAATGTYNSTQRLMIDSEFQAMGAEIDRIARATDFNGIHLLDGSLAGEHDGSGLNATGAMKIHFGTGNESAEDYYYVEMGDCTTAGLGLRQTTDEKLIKGWWQEAEIDYTRKTIVLDISSRKSGSYDNSPEAVDGLYGIDYYQLPIGLKNITVISNTPNQSIAHKPHVCLFLRNGTQLTGPPTGFKPGTTSYATWNPEISQNGNLTHETLGNIWWNNQSSSKVIDECIKNDIFDVNAKYNSDNIIYNQGEQVTISGITIKMITSQNEIGCFDAFMHGGDPVSTPKTDEIIEISEITSDLVFMIGGHAPPNLINGCNNYSLKIEAEFTDTFLERIYNESTGSTGGDIISIDTQEKAQQALGRIDDAIVKKDNVRAHLGALQNRLENTISNLSIQAENLQASESRISDTDVATEMTAFVRNQILTESATAMLSQANSFPHMLMNLLG